MTDASTSSKQRDYAGRLRGWLGHPACPARSVQDDLRAGADEIDRLRALLREWLAGCPAPPEWHWSFNLNIRTVNTLGGSVHETVASPVAWTIPGDDTADMNGFIPARVNREGEFTQPLYTRPAVETTYCTRSLPHENMNAACQQLTVIARQQVNGGAGQ